MTTTAGTADSALLSTHDRLRAVALELFARRGYSGASMGEIASRVGVRKATLYNYYRSKEALLLDLFEESVESWRRASRPILEESGPVANRLFRHLEAALAFATEHPYEIAVVRVAASQIGGALGKEVRGRLEERTREYVDRLEGLFADAVEKNEVRRADPRDLALAWRAIMDGLLTDKIFDLGGGELDPERLRRIWELVWGGFAAPGSAP